MEKNSLPMCQCHNDCNKQAEYTIIYGKSPENDYCFACEEHIHTLIKNIEESRQIKIKMYYVEHYSSNTKYDRKWSDTWEDRYVEALS